MAVITASQCGERATGAEWAWFVYTVDGQAVAELTEARSRALGFDLRGPATAKFEIDGHSLQGAGLLELACDLYVYRDRELLFRGRLGSTDDDLSADQHTTSWTAVDYRGMLDTRIYEIDTTYTNLPQADIAWAAVMIAQDGPGGPLGITRGPLQPAPVARTELVEADTRVDEALDRFQDYADGFEWWIDPELRFQAYTWRGISRDDFPLAWGTTATAIRRSYDTTRFANWVRVRGGRPEGADQDTPEPFADRSANLAIRPEGRIARTVNNSDLKDQAAVNAAADQLLADSLNPPATYAVTLRPGIWRGAGDLWLGDTAPFVLRSGRLDIATTARVNQLDIALGDNGDETVALTVGTE